jgi:hypothetical protein
MLAFQNYVRSEGTLQEIGTVISQITGGKLQFCPGTIDRYNSGTIKAMSILLFNKAGESVSVPMSKALSTQVAKALQGGMMKSKILAAISKLPMYEDEDLTVIGRPQGSAEEELVLAVAEAKKLTVTYDELIAF